MSMFLQSDKTDSLCEPPPDGIIALRSGGRHLVFSLELHSIQTIRTSPPQGHSSCRMPCATQASRHASWTSARCIHVASFHTERSTVPPPSSMTTCTNAWPQAANCPAHVVPALLGLSCPACLFLGIMKGHLRFLLVHLGMGCVLADCMEQRTRHNGDDACMNMWMSALLSRTRSLAKRVCDRGTSRRGVLHDTVRLHTRKRKTGTTLDGGRNNQ